MQNLVLDRPLVCFDLETTGTNIADDRIVQIALIRVEPDGGRHSFTSLVNPGRPIPPQATAVHGITDAQVQDAPSLRRIRADVEEMLHGADLAGFNILRFDLPLLEVELQRVGSTYSARGRRVLDAMAIFHRMEPRNLEAAVRFYLGADLPGAHSAEVDATATLEVLDAQLARYGDLPRDPQALHEFCNPDGDRFVDRTRKFRWDDDGEAVFTFGKYRDQTLRAVVELTEGRDYLQWMKGKDFTDEVKAILDGALGGAFPRRR
jgi:DNA polymerase-3 subunit epsilon